MGDNIEEENEAFILNSLPEAYKEVKNALKYGRELVTIGAITTALKTKELKL